MNDKLFFTCVKICLQEKLGERTLNCCKEYMCGVLCYTELRELHTKQQPSTAKHSLLLTSCCLFLRMGRGRRWGLALVIM